MAPPDFALSESPRYVGRAIASWRWIRIANVGNQQSVSLGKLARVYGFTHLDVTSPDIWQQMEDAEKN